MGSLVIVDDHPLIRIALKVLLEQAGHRVAAEATNGLEAIQCIKDHTPDMVILDLDIPQLDGLSVMAYLSTNQFSVKTLILTSSASENFAARCLKAGARGFINKYDALDDVTDAVKTILKGRTFFPENAFKALQALDTYDYASTLPKPELTNREVTVLRLLGQGKNNQEIATALFISHKTISTYKMRLLKKFNTTHLLALIDAARAMKFI
ncbi:Two-component transcriptional response regulator, LuxR family [Pseudomonas orientalis]|uniref:response regulator transcription factor n=1 Tax=Pseudomonas orientalis TaxID=76758 RepID=UPI000F58D575|nr:response regulator transcription factor [Pseudomonas orientalis]AZE95481.1 Two-component transcriptional response regulator, LuxR family [Pseudomonas orientalis]